MSKLFDDLALSSTGIYQIETLHKWNKWIMFKLFSQPRFKESNSSNKEQSFINLDFKTNIRIEGKILINLLSLLVGLSVAGGGFYGIYNNLSPSDQEFFNSPNHTESVDQFSNANPTN